MKWGLVIKQTISKKNMSCIVQNIKILEILKWRFEIYGFVAFIFQWALWNNASLVFSLVVKMPVKIPTECLSYLTPASY